MRITAILVCWEDGGDLLEAIESLSAARRRLDPATACVRLVVVFNGTTAVPRERLLALWPGATLVENPVNRGFGPAANQGALAGGGDVLLFLNPDVRAEGELFGAIARGFEEHPETVALAPRLLDWGEAPSSPAPKRALAPPGREDQFTFQLRRLPRLSSDARELLLFDHLFPENRSRRRSRYADEDRTKAFPVEQAAAAALALRAEVFQRIGGFDERFVPAWYEDVDLCARLARLGTILYWPAAALRHRGGVASNRLGYDRFLPIFYANAIRYRRIHYGVCARAMYRALLAAGMLLRLAVLPLRPQVPRSRKQAARAYLRVLSLAMGMGSFSVSRFPFPDLP